MVTRTFTKDLYALAKSIDKLSCGQARISDIEDDTGKFEVELAISGGLYKGGKFKFSFQVDCTNYPVKPDIICMTPIYHPNIDTTEGSSSLEPNICVSLLDEWEESYGFEDCVQALLFLFYQPNLSDPLCPIISPDIEEEEFEQNVKISLGGGDVEGIMFETNYGLKECEIPPTEVNNNFEIGNLKEVLITDESTSVENNSDASNIMTDNPNCTNSETDTTVNKMTISTGPLSEKIQDYSVNLCKQSDSAAVNELQVMPRQEDKKTNILTNLIKSGEKYHFNSFQVFRQYSNDFCLLDSLVPCNILLSLVFSNVLKRFLNRGKTK